MAKPRYMRKQRDINHSMRSILVDWLVEVSQEYRLDSQTLFMAVSYIDRFLSEMSVQRGKLQLVGVTAMLLASKYEEIYPPAVDEFVYITDNTYSRDQVQKKSFALALAYPPPPPPPPASSVGLPFASTPPSTTPMVPPMLHALRCQLRGWGRHTISDDASSLLPFMSAWSSPPPLRYVYSSGGA